MPFRIYIETTIPSFYYEERAEPENIARREWTKRWWNDYRHVHVVCSSAVVIDELRQGDHPYQADKIRLLEQVTLLPYSDEIGRIAEVYMDRFLMPSKASNDALHMAFASFHRCHILLTWNCAHLANPTKYKHLVAINSELALPVPEVATPLNLLEGDDEV